MSDDQALAHLELLAKNGQTQLADLKVNAVVISWVDNWTRDALRLALERLAKAEGVNAKWTEMFSNFSEAVLSMGPHEDAERPIVEALLDKVKENATLRRERDEARAALEPFAALADYEESGPWKPPDHCPLAACPGDTRGNVPANMGHCRAARAACKRAEGTAAKNP